MKRAFALIIACALALTGCIMPPMYKWGALPGSTDAPVSPTPEPTYAPTPVITTEPTPELTPEPTPSAVTIGAIGDIMAMESQIAFAKKGDAYDFTQSLLPMEELFKGVDIMLGNLETPLAGSETGYSRRNDRSAHVDGSPTSYQTFNAPDGLLYSLRDMGFDVLSLANNHSIDRGLPGVLRTARVVGESGVLGVGAYSSRSDREKARIIDINGMKIGFVACTNGFNGKYGLLGDDKYALASTRNLDAVERDIELCRQSGAEFIIMIAHWGDEYSDTYASYQLDLAKRFISMGADAIFGSHPHVVQQIEWVSAVRGDGEVSAPVVFSLGNFMANMSAEKSNFGLYVKMTLVREDDGGIAVDGIEYMPLYCARMGVSGGTLHVVLPCYADTGRVKGIDKTDDLTLSQMERARKHVTDVIGYETASPIE